MKDFIGLTKRNILIYFKDVLAIIFSLLTSMIVFVLYLLFLKDTFVDALTATMKGLENIVSSGDIDMFVNGMLLSGILGSTLITVPYTCLKYMLHDMYNDMHLNPFGYCADIGFKILYGIDTGEINAIEAMKLRNVPVLFVHGGDDDWIDVDNSVDMYDEAQKHAHSELWIVPGASHAKARDVAGKDAYRDKIGAFLDAAGVVGEAASDAEAA